MNFAYRLIKPMSEIEMFAPDGFLSVFSLFPLIAGTSPSPQKYLHIIE